MKWKKIVAGGLTGAMLLMVLSGCGAEEVKEKAAQQPAATQTEDESDEVMLDFFALAYQEKDSFNPFTCTSPENQLLAQLCYEGLFALDQNFQPQKKLCKSITREGSRSYTLTVEPDIRFHNGDTISPQDVVYSLNQARLLKNSGYKEQLSCISSVKYSDNEIYIRLYTAKSTRALSALLDVPIIRKGTDDENGIPDGTGAFQIVRKDNKVTLQSFAQWHGGSVGFGDAISLIASGDSSGSANLLSSGEISMLIQQDVEASPISSGKYKTDIPTTRLHYLGINCGWGVLGDPDIRTALSMLMDREAIVRTCFSDRATAVSLPVAVVPKDITAPDYQVKEALELLEDAGIYDKDDDGYLDISSGRPFKVEFIYNADYGTKGAVLEQYVNTLNEAGIRASIKPLGFDECRSKLRKETFQIYYGEYEMTPDFDLSSLISRNGTRNFGNYENNKMEKAINKLNNAEDEAWEGAFEDYLELFMDETPIIPIVFEHAQIISEQKMPTGFSPWPTNVFHNIEKWK